MLEILPLGVASLDRGLTGLPLGVASLDRGLNCLPLGVTSFDRGLNELYPPMDGGAVLNCMYKRGGGVVNEGVSDVGVVNGGRLLSS